MEFKINNLRFITSNSYFDGDEFDLATQFEIPFNRLYFPKEFLDITNFDYHGNIPDYEYFVNFLDNEKEKFEKQQEKF